MLVDPRFMSKSRSENQGLYSASTPNSQCAFRRNKPPTEAAKAAHRERERQRGQRCPRSRSSAAASEVAHAAAALLVLLLRGVAPAVVEAARGKRVEGQ